ncbi:MAG: hypothetical protein GX640_22450 [Fibrobacter sp.]|nr:hypothetical protein [Fibrobacter sp.]
MKNVLLIFSFFFLVSFITDGATQEPAQNDSDNLNYQIEQPGTITFTEGAKIKGKVDKPQVIIFLPKEKTYYKDITLERSFEKELMEPLPFVHVQE